MMLEETIVPSTIRRWEGRNHSTGAHVRRYQSPSRQEIPGKVEACAGRRGMSWSCRVGREGPCDKRHQRGDLKGMEGPIQVKVVLRQVLSVPSREVGWNSRPSKRAAQQEPWGEAPGPGQAGSRAFPVVSQASASLQLTSRSPRSRDGASLAGVLGPCAGVPITQRCVFSPACPPPCPRGTAVPVTPSFCSVKTPHSKLLPQAAGGREQLGRVARFWQRPGMSPRWILCP